MLLRNPVLRFAFVILAYVLLSAIVIGANPFKGETTAPMDLLLSYTGWSSVGEEGEVVHRERSDVLDAFIPQWSEVKRSLREDGLGLWNQVSSGGRPAVIDLSRSLLTPSFLMFNLVEDDWLGFYLACLIKLLIACLGAYLFLSFFVSRQFAFIGGLLFSLIGFHSAWFYWPHVATSIWIPWVLWGVTGWCQRLEPRWFIALVLSTLMLILGGFPSVAGFGLYTAGFLIIVLAFSSGSYSVRSALLVVASSFFAILIAFMLAAIPLYGLYETLTLVDLSDRRGGTPLNIRKDWLLFWDAYLYGSPRVEKNLYMGKVALLLALIAMVFAAFKSLLSRREKLLLYFSLALFVGSILLAFGLLPHTLIRSIPVFSSNPWSRVIVIIDMAMVFLAILVLQVLLRKLQNLRSNYLVYAGYLVLGVVVVFQVIDQVRVFRDFNAVIGKEHYLPGTPSINYVNGNLHGLQSVVTDRSFLVSGTLGSYGLPEWFAHGFKTPAEKKLLGRIVERPFVTPTAAIFNADSINFESPILDKMGIAYLLLNKKKLTSPVARSQKLGGHKAAPPMPESAISQIINLHNPIHMSAVEIILATYRKPKAPSDVLLNIIHNEEIIASSVVGEKTVKDNKWTRFEFAESVLLQPGEYELHLELKNKAVSEKLTAYYVSKPSNTGDRLRLGEGVFSGALLYKIYDYERPSVNFKQWEKYDLEPEIFVMKNKDVPVGGYFISSIDESSSWSDEKVQTVVVKPEAIDVKYTGVDSGFIVLPMRSYPGWKVFVNGEEKEPVTYMGVLPAVQVDGVSNIEFRYWPGWLGSGLTVMSSGIALLVLFLIVLLKYSDVIRRIQRRDVIL